MELSRDTVLFGRWQLEDRLGTGLSGETWRARDLETGEAVAVKSGPRSLFHEAELLTTLDHPHVVRCRAVMYEAGAGHPVLVTDCVEGGDLAQHVAERGPYAPTAAARLGLQLVDALETLHARGVLHRDLKPQNVLVTLRDQALPLLQVCDFGIARRLKDGEVRVTEVVITRGYSPPEQLAGRSLTAASDLHALGGCLRFVATGRHPDEAGGDAGVLAPLVDRLLAQDPSARPDLSAVRAALREAAEGRLTLVPEGSPVTGAPAKVAWWALGGVAAALALGVWLAPEPSAPTGPRGTPLDPADERLVIDTLAEAVPEPQPPPAAVSPPPPKQQVRTAPPPASEPEPIAEAPSTPSVAPAAPIPVTVISYPQARIVVDGTYVRDTVLKGVRLELAPGNHSVRLEIPGDQHTVGLDLAADAPPQRICWHFERQAPC